PDTELLLVGGGTEYEKIRTEAEQINAQIGRQYITTTGPVSNVNEYCAAADIFVGVSRSLLEAMAAAKPVILAGNQGSLGIFDETKITPAVDTNFCCRGFAQASEDDLLRDITALLTAPKDELAAMGDYNRAFVGEYYTTARMAKDYVRMYEKTLASPAPYFGAPDLVVSGYYGFGNLGDESLLDIIAAAFAQEKKGVKIAALTRKPKADARRTGLKCISRISVPAVLSAFGKAKLLVSGGGSLLQDATSKRSLLYYAAVMNAAKHRGAKVAVFANGIGPISHDSNRKLAGKTLEGADHVSVRDPASAAEIERLGVQRAVTVRADPAFLIQSADPIRLSKIRTDLGLTGEYFVVSVRSMPQGQKTAAEIKTLDDRILEQCVRFCNAISKTYHLTPLILPMQESHDRALCEKLTKSVQNAVLYAPASAPELIGMLSDAQFTVGMRLHAVIFASSAAVPVIGLSYDPKVDAMMDSLGQPYSIKVTETDTIAQKVCAAAEEVMKNRSSIVQTLTEKAEQMRTLCREDVRDVIQYLE
ncbi:MAG: polysaccharide pyruvyl transferase CsaB, partial [Clostridia bacterium]|nr:polysaccharide pyruvyl transferase CsaB [Clostridia bacterium]